MGVTYIGKNGNDFDLTYEGRYLISSLIQQLSGKMPSDFEPASNRDCQEWARLLKSNLPKIREFTLPAQVSLGQESWQTVRKFLTLDGADLKQLFSSGPYAPSGKGVSPQALASVRLEPLNVYWSSTIGSFIMFLEECGGIIVPNYKRMRKQ